MISLDSLASLLQVRGGDLLTPLMYVLELQAVTMATRHLHEFWESGPHSHF